MAYVNSRGEVVDHRQWSIKSPIYALLAIWTAIKLFFVTLFGGTTPSQERKNGGSFGGSSGSSGGSSGGWGGWGRGSGSGGGGSSGAPPRPRFGGFGSSGGFRSPPPGCSPCAGGSCGR